MGFFVRLCDECGNSVSCFQKSFFRNAIALIIALTLFLRERTKVENFSIGLDKRTWPLLITRCVLGALGIFANFYALSVIPIGEAMALNKTAPFFTVLFAGIFLSEKINLRQAVYLALGFLGAVLVIKPGFRALGTFAALCGLIGGIAAGGAYTCVRKLGRHKVDGAFIVLFFSAFSTIASIPFMAVHFDKMNMFQLLVMTGAGCGAAIGQFGVTAAYRYSSPREVAVYDYTNIVFASLLGFFFLNQLPDALSFLGFAIILLAAICSRSGH